METRFIQLVSTFGPINEVGSDVLKQLKGNFPPLVSRRLTTPALMMGECLKDFEICQSDAFIHATTFSETNCLEKYLASFPTPSPLMFQNSIHPSGIEQVLIARKQPIEEFMSFGGDSGVIHSVLVAAFTSTQPNQWLVGAEERGTWLTEKKCAYETCFAFAIKLSCTEENAIGKIEWSPNTEESEVEQTVFTTFDFMQLLRERKDQLLRSDSLGHISINWFSS